MLLVVTSCIHPVKQEFLMLDNSDDRLKFTCEGLLQMLQFRYFDKVIICDSSAFDFTGTQVENLLKEYGIEYEILTFMGSYDRVRIFGKGYGEGQIMQYIFNHSFLIRSENYFFKITGRLYISNLNQIVSRLKSDVNYFDIVTLKYFKAIDTRFYSICVDDFMRGLYDACEFVDDKNGRWYEIVFRDLLKSRNVKFKQYPVYPEIRGVSGTHGIDMFKSDINHHLHVLFTKLDMHNTMISAILMYVVLKFSTLLKFDNY